MADGDIFRGDEVGVGTAAQALVKITTTSGREAYAVAALAGGSGVGGATSANQTTEITALGAVTEAAPASDTASSGLNGRLQRIAQRITSLIALLPAALGAGGGIKVDGSGTALPVAAAVADGSNITEGAKADAAYADGTGAAAGSLVALNKGQYVLTAAMSAKLPASLGIKTAAASMSIAPASDGIFQTTGAVASGAADSGNPVKTGAVYNSTLPTFTTGQRGDMQLDTRGGLVVTLKGNNSTSVPNVSSLSADASSASTGLWVNAQNTIWNGASWDRLPGNTSGQFAQGNVAAAVADAGNPVKMGGVGSSTVLTAVTSGQRQNAWLSLNGAMVIAAASRTAISDAYNNSTIGMMAMNDANFGPLAIAGMGFNGTSWDKTRSDTNGAVTQPHAMASSRWVYATPTGGIVNTTTAVTVASAAGIGVRNYITGMQVDFDALVTATEFAIRDGAGGTVLFRAKLPAGAAGSRTYTFPVPLKGTANTLVEVVTLTAAGAAVGVYPNVQGFQGS